MGNRMVKVGSYWKRRQLGPDHKGLGTPWELHMNIPVGGYVEVYDNPMHMRSVVGYCRVGTLESDIITDRLFRMYFEPADKQDIGLIKLIELDS